MGIFENCPGCGELIASWGHTCGAWPSPSNLPAQPTASPRREDAAGRVEAIAARLKAATPGPWEWQGKRLNGGPANAVGVVSHGAAWDVTAGDAEFIANAPADIAYLLAALSTAERVRDALRDAAKSLLMLLDEWAWTAHHTVQSPGIKATVAQSDMVQRRTKLWELVARVPSGRTPEDV